MSSAAATLTPECEKEIEEFFKKLHLATDGHDTEFIINLENVWGWLGYAKKGNAKRLLVSCAEENVDYKLISDESKIIGDAENAEKAGRPTVDIFLTVDCFKSIFMMAKTEQAKLVRKFYLTLEKRLRVGDLTLAAEVVANFDAANDTRTDVLLRTTPADDEDVDLPLWVRIWREQRKIQMESGKDLRAAQTEMLSKMNVSLSAAIENLHNQAVLGFEGTSKRWLSDNGIPNNVSVADCMDREQLDLRRMMSIRLLQLYAEIDEPTPRKLKDAALKLKEYISKTSNWLNLDSYHPVVDEETGEKMYFAKKVHKLELAHKRSQKRIKALERKQELLALQKATTNNFYNPDTVNNNNA
jgi:phage anti-repressor protein